MMEKCFLAVVVIVWLGCVPWMPCSSRPMDHPPPGVVAAAGGAENGSRNVRSSTSNNRNRSMVVRIVSSSSSSSNDDFSHLFLPRSRSVNGAPRYGQQELGPGSFVLSATKAAGATAEQEHQREMTTSSRLFIGNEGISNKRPVTEAPLTPPTTTTTTTTPKPTTYRPKLRFNFPFFTLMTTLSPTTTIRPLPAQEDIFSVFYRAFTQSHEASSSSFATFHNNGPLLPSGPGNSETESNSTPLVSGSRTIETIQILPRAAPHYPFKNAQGSQAPPLPSNFDRKEKVITSVVTRTSSSASLKLPLMNRNYPRIRPSSLMMTSLNKTAAAAPLNNATEPNNLDKQDPPNIRINRNLTDISNPTTTPNPSSPKAFEDPENVTRDPTLDWSNKNVGSTGLKDAAQGMGSGNAPRAEALIQSSDDGSPVVNSPYDGTNRFRSKNPSTTSLELTITESSRNWQIPEQVWNEPAKVWGEPAKVWGEPEKVWSEPANKALSQSPEAEQEETQLVPVLDSYDPEQKSHSNERGEDDDEEAPQGTFYELGEDEDETPSDTIPAALTNNNKSVELLPELSPQEEHSFISSPSGLHVAHSIQVSIQRRMDFRVNATTISSGSGHNKLPYGLRNTKPSESAGSDPMTTQNGTTGEHERSSTSAKKFGYVLDGRDVRKYRVEERTADGYIVGEYGVLNSQNGFLHGVRYTADGTINPGLIHEALMKFLSL